MNGMTRLQVHTKVDELFDELDAIAERTHMQHELHRMLFKNTTSDSIEGCILVGRHGDRRAGSFVTWGLSPMNAGLHSGHYDLNDMDAEADWCIRSSRGW